MRDKDNNSGMTTNVNEDRERNYQCWKYSQPDQTRSVNEEDGQKVYQGRKQSRLNEMVNSAVGSEGNQK